MRLDREFSEFIEFLNAHEVQYLIVGGYAVGAHGLPRATKDLDVWVQAEQQNAQRLMSLIANKRATGRRQDLADADRLEGLE